MPGETILCRLRDQPEPYIGPSSEPTKVLAWWALSTPVVSSVDGKTYVDGADFVVFNPLTDGEEVIQKKMRDQISARVSAITGGTYTAADVRGFRAIRTGSVTLATPDTSKAVTFTNAMPSANYKVMAFGHNFSLALDITSQTTAGFTFTFAPGNAGALDWLAVEDAI